MLLRQKWKNLCYSSHFYYWRTALSLLLFKHEGASKEEQRKPEMGFLLQWVQTANPCQNFWTSLLSLDWKGSINDSIFVEIVLNIKINFFWFQTTVNVKKCCRKKTAGTAKLESGFTLGSFGSTELQNKNMSLPNWSRRRWALPRLWLLPNEDTLIMMTGSSGSCSASTYVCVSKHPKTCWTQETRLCFFLRLLWIHRQRKIQNEKEAGLCFIWQLWTLMLSCFFQMFSHWDCPFSVEVTYFEFPNPDVGDAKSAICSDTLTISLKVSV